MNITALFKKLTGQLFVCLVMQLWVCPSLLLASEQVLFYHTDPIGTPLAMTDGSGNVVWQADYKPFGEENSMTGSAVNSKRFVGKEKDTETGLDYFGARYMNDKTGRFLAIDPVGGVDEVSNKTNEKMLLNPQRLNSYAYGLNNPFKFVDANGRLTVYIWPRDDGHVGHASLELENKTYISWWPEGKGALFVPYSPDLKRTLERDVHEEGNRFPERIYIPGLNEDRIARWWSDFKKNNSYELAHKNCSTIVAKALKVGGADSSYFIDKGSRDNTLVWTPDRAKNYALKIRPSIGKKPIFKNNHHN